MPPASTIGIRSQSVGSIQPKTVDGLVNRTGAKKKLRRKSSPKKPSLGRKVYLKHTWGMWFETDHKAKLGSFNTIQDFWRYYNQLVDPTNFPHNSNLSIYKVNPTLPDEIPNKSCKWTIPTSKDDTGKVWMKVVLAMIGEQFFHSNLIAGVVISVYPVLDNVTLWGSDCSNSAQIDEITSQLRKLVENDTVHILSYQKETRSTTSPSLESNRGKFSSSNDLVLVEDNEQSTASSGKHKKSSSFSNSQFPDMSSTNFRRHRKTKSDTKKSNISCTRKSISFSEDVITPSKTTTTTTNLLSNQRMSLLAQMYNNGPQVEPFQVKRSEDALPVAQASTASVEVLSSSSQFTLSQMISLFVLVLLLLSGFIFTK